MIKSGVPLDYYLIQEKGEIVKDSYYHEQVTILVSDLSGFTSTTRKHGIVHFASIIVRMR